MQPNNKLILPIAIVIAGALMGGAIIYTQRGPATNVAKTKTADTAQKPIVVKPVTSIDHILGNPAAKVVVVEYSDTECPYCKTFDGTMGKIMDTYGKESMVAWVYRQFPIPSLHPKAPKEAEATECVNQIAGNDVFWKYLRGIYAITPSNNNLDPIELTNLAVKFGLNKKDFQQCLDSGTFTEKIQNDYNDAVAAGAQGTPYSVLIPKFTLNDIKVGQLNELFITAATQYGGMAPSQLGYVTSDKKVILNGNLPYSLVQQIISIIVS